MFPLQNYFWGFSVLFPEFSSLIFAVKTNKNNSVLVERNILWQPFFRSIPITKDVFKSRNAINTELQNFALWWHNMGKVTDHAPALKHFISALSMRTIQVKQANRNRGPIKLFNHVSLQWLRSAAHRTNKILWLPRKATVKGQGSRHRLIIFFNISLIFF